MKFTEYVEVNPKTNLKKGEYAPFVEMANVSITYREQEIYKWPEISEW